MQEVTERLAVAPSDCRVDPFHPDCVCGGSLHTVTTANGTHYFRHNRSGPQCRRPRPVSDCDCVVCTAVEMLGEIAEQLVERGHLEGNHQAVADLLSAVHSLTDDIVAEALFWGAYG